MANIPNARRYRTNGNQSSNGYARRARWQEQYDSNAYHHAGARAAQANAVGGLIALLVLAALLIAFPIPVLVICLIAFAAKLFFVAK